MPGDNYDEINFSTEVVGGGENTTVRVTKADAHNGRWLSARDVIAVVCGKDANASGLVWRRLQKTQMMAELTPHLSEFNFDSGRGSRTQPVLTLQGCFKLLMMLPGERAKLFRSASARVLLGYFAGDEQLVAEIRANATNADLLNELAREELRGEREVAGGGGAPPPNPVSDLEQRRLAVEVGKQELALQRAQVRMRVEEKNKLGDADVAVQIKLSDAARASREKDVAAEVATKNKLAATERDNEDRASDAKRRRLDEEALAERRRIDAEIALVRARAEAILETQRANVAAAVKDLTTALRDAGQPPELIAAAVAALLARLGATNAPPQAQAAPQGPQAPPPEFVARPVGYFTVREFMNDGEQTPLFLMVRANQREQFLRDMGKRLVADCRFQHIDFKKGVKVPGEVFPVTLYAANAAPHARANAEFMVRNLQAGPGQRDIRGAWSV